MSLYSLECQSLQLTILELWSDKVGAAVCDPETRWWESPPIYKLLELEQPAGGVSYCLSEDSRTLGLVKLQDVQDKIKYIIDTMCFFFMLVLNDSWRTIGHWNNWLTGYAEPMDGALDTAFLGLVPSKYIGL